MGPFIDLFATYDIASLVGDKGFNKQCLGYYRIDNKKILINNTFAEIAYQKERVPLIPAPIWDQVFEWFRQEHRLHLDVFPVHTHIDDNPFNYVGWVISTDINKPIEYTENEIIGQAYEEVREKILFYALTLI
jgi:hypothetical protein